MTLRLEVRLDMNAQPNPQEWTPSPTPVPQELPEGTVLHDTYRILHPLGEGGCGAVYAAAHTRLPGHFAVKVLHRGLVRNLEAMSRFRHEAEITSTLRHPHIVQVLDFNVTPDGFPYLVMELLEGRPLAARLAEGVPVDSAAAVRIVGQIAQALQAAHARGIVHRDLKPDNVMLLAADGVQDFVKVLDFGISQASWRPRLTDNLHVAGTPQFMSPEQACGLRDEIGPWSDQFSLAAIAYNLLTGREPFAGEDPIAVLYQVVHNDPPPPSRYAPLSPEVDAVIMRGLAKKPAERFPDVLAFAQVLRLALAQAPARALGVPPAESLAPAPAAEWEAAVTLDEPPPVRAFDAPRPVPPEPDPVPLPGRQTARLIRKVRRRIHPGGRRLAMLVVAAALAVAWFSPAARARGIDAWHRAHAQAQRLLRYATR
jgi:serine/threonine protein kinase